MKYNGAIKNFQQEIMNEEKKTAKDLNKNEKQSLFNKSVDLKEDNLEKYGHALKVIENLKIPKIEESSDKKKSANIVEILSTVSLVNNLLSDKFKGLVNNMDKLNVVNIEKDTKDKIEKIRHEIKLDEKYERKRKQDYKKKIATLVAERSKSKGKGLKDNDGFQTPILHTVGNTNDTTNKFHTGTNPTHTNETQSYISTTSPIKKLKEAIGINTRLNTDYNYSTNNQSSKYQPEKARNLYSSTEKHMKFDPNKPKESQITTHSTGTSYRVRSAYPRKTNTHLDEVPIYKIDDYVFNNDFNKKIDYFEAISTREINYQKKLLGLKKNEKFYIPDFDLMKTKEDCEGFFQRTLSNKKKKITGYGDDTTSKRLLIE